MDEMSVEKWWNEICGRGKREKHREKSTQTPFRPPRKPHGGTETRTRDPSGGRRAPNRLRHDAAFNLTIKGPNSRGLIIIYHLLYFSLQYTSGQDKSVASDLLPSAPLNRLYRGSSIYFLIYTM